MKPEELIYRLYNLYRSGTSLFFISTYEEERLENLLNNLAKKISYQYRGWAVSLGKDPLTSLTDEFSYIRKSHRILWLGKDLYNFWEEPTVIREILELLTNREVMIVLSHPFLMPPRRLLIEGESLSLPLPSYRERMNYIKGIVERSGIEFDTKIIDMAAQLTAGLTYKQIFRVIKRVLHNKSQDDIIESLLNEKKRLLSTTTSIEVVDLDVNLDDIGGLDELKRWVKQRKEAFSIKAREYGLPQPRGILLTGIQGCGKSLFAKALAKIWSLPLLRLDFNRLFASSSPEGELELSLQIAELNSPVILWIDEIDKLFIEGEGGGTLYRILARFLTWLQEKTSPVFVVATSNKVENLPPELARRGRFDEIFFVDLPDLYEREEIFKVHLRKRSRDPDRFDLEKLSKLTEYFTGAEIEQVVVSALFRAFSENRDINMKDLEREIKNTVPLYFTYEEEIKRMREWAKGRARLATIDRKKLILFEEVKR